MLRWIKGPPNRDSSVEDVRTRATRKTERHKARVIIASFDPVGYSASSGSLSSASASFTGVVSTVFSPVPA